MSGVGGAGGAGVSDWFSYLGNTVRKRKTSKKIFCDNTIYYYTIGMEEKNGNKKKAGDQIYLGDNSTESEDN